MNPTNSSSDPNNKDPNKKNNDEKIKFMVLKLTGMTILSYLTLIYLLHYANKNSDETEEAVKTLCFNLLYTTMQYKIYDISNISF